MAVRWGAAKILDRAPFLHSSSRCSTERALGAVLGSETQRGTDQRVGKKRETGHYRSKYIQVSSYHRRSSREQGEGIKGNQVQSEGSQEHVP